LAVTWAAAIWLAGSLLGAQSLTTHYGRKTPADKGPRALGLVQLSPAGKKGRIIPIAIMIDGKFFDASSYKAAPVPLALDFGVVYEGFRDGVSQGVFTITQPGQLNHAWIAEGTWLPAGAIDPTKRKKYSTPVIADDDKDKDGPPVLHRRSEKTDSGSGTDSKDKDKDKDKDQPKPVATAPAAASGAGTSSPPEAAKAPAAPEAGKTPAPTEPAKSSASDETNADPNQPRLRRGKPAATAHQEPFATFEALETPPAATADAGGSGKADATAKKSAAASPKSAFIFIPAISDIGGPDPRPYAYEVKPEEEASYRSKMLELATRLGAQASAGTNETAPGRRKASSAKATSKSAGKPGNPAFDDVSLRIFDLSNSNEPVLVLSAKTHPPVASADGSSQETKEITLIARTNLEGELQKLFFSQTDSRHLDVTPRMELIDAVDADGDGRGELLFRRTFDDGSAYAIYRVTADRLWPLFEGTP